MRTWLITCGTTSLGRILTEKLLQRGDRVAVALGMINALDDLKARYGDQLWMAKPEITDTNSIRHVIDSAFSELGQIDVVIINAACVPFCAVDEAVDEQNIGKVNKNLIDSILIISAALPHLRKQGCGRILQLSSAGNKYKAIM